MKTPRTNKRKRHERFLHRDGILTRFPVSNFVLNLIHKPRRELSTTPNTRWRPSFVQQTASLALVLVLCASSFGITFGNPLSTLSYFRDVEISTDNQFAAGLLAFRLNPGDVTIPIHEGDVVALSPLFTPDPETFDIKYRVRAKVIGTHTSLCSLLNASGTSMPYIYDGLLADLVTKPATTTGHGHLDVSLPNAAGIVDGTECTVALVYDGWYVDAPENTGYTDSKQDTFTFVYDAPEEAIAPFADESAVSETSDTTTTYSAATLEETVDKSETPRVPIKEEQQSESKGATSASSSSTETPPVNNGESQTETSTTTPDVPTTITATSTDE